MGEPPSFDRTILDDMASSLGGEATVAFDGALLPTPAWVSALEVDDASRLQGAIERAIPSVTKEVADGRTYYAITTGSACRFTTPSWTATG